ncbi:hypothetical protein D0T21_09690 [Duganella sp. BJB476]|nr:hypothetical protein D0T21_09690 [Duganella sp. BJB476]
MVDAEADLQRVYDIFSIGKDARSIGVLLTNVRNCMHFFELLTAIEREFFMVHGEPDEDYPDEEPQDECLVNSWGSTEREYIDQFRAALAAKSDARYRDGFGDGAKLVEEITAERDAARNQLVQHAASVEAVPEPFNHYGLSTEQLQQLLDGGLKPEEISGADDVQHDRVHELVWWFARLTQGNANSKWAVRHACELAYFIAANGINRNIDLKAIRDAAFKEGVNITPEERGTLERIGFTVPPAAAKVAQGFPERDLTKPAEQQGMFRKFDVRRVDGSDAPGGKHHGCRYFVLDMDHDMHAGPALAAYAESCRASHHALSDEMIAEFGSQVAQDNGRDAALGKFLKALEQMDFHQFAMHRNPCWRIDEDGRFCGRDKAWAGHQSGWKYVSLKDAIAVMAAQQGEKGGAL